MEKLIISSKFLLSLHVLFILIYRQRRVDEEPALSKAKEQISLMINELREFKKEQTTLTADLEQLKFKKSELTDKLVIATHFFNYKSLPF